MSSIVFICWFLVLQSAHFSTSQDYEDSSSDGDTLILPRPHSYVFHDLTTRTRRDKLRNLLRYLGKSKYNFKDYKDTIKYGVSRFNYDYTYNDDLEAGDTNKKEASLIKSFYNSMSSWFKKHKHAFKKWVTGNNEKQENTNNRRNNRNKD